ncbi:MAG: DUF1553 domain-containing protein [Verrucomicrobia bacterium]|nr:DUF1553 domain-containing protein [Verrucomicrobiota bacterium]
MRRFAAILGLLVSGVVLAATPPGPPREPFEAAAFAVPQSRIDVLVFGRLAKENLAPALPCSDAVFVRRVFLDLIGTLPTPDEVAAFLSDKASDKRAKLVETLFTRNEFTDYWAMKWSDLLRVKAEFPVNLWPTPAQAYHRLLRTCVRNNLPLDRFARGLLTASGSNMRVPEANFFRAVQNREARSLAAAVSLTFMGVRQESWSPAELDALSVCFSRIGYKTTMEWKEEIVFFDEATAAPKSPVRMPDGQVLAIPPERDPRAAFADWLLQPDNPWFARNLTNRAWCWLLGRGIIHEADDLRKDNPPSHPELLAYLEKEFVSHGYDLRHLFRLIVNSRTYQLSCLPADSSPRALELFAAYPIRRLDAEVLIDAICAVTGTSETYSSAIPEPFTFLPDGSRAIALPDGSISSPFLELFGRPARDSGFESERNSNPSAAQRLHFLNSSQIRAKIEQGSTLRKLVRNSGGPNNIAVQLYTDILSRPPTAAETAIVRETLSTTTNRREALIDITWALFNTTEFLCRH